MNNTHSNPIPLDKKVPTMEGKGFSESDPFSRDLPILWMLAKSPTWMNINHHPSRIWDQHGLTGDLWHSSSATLRRWKTICSNPWVRWGSRHRPRCSIATERWESWGKDMGIWEIHGILE